MFRNAVCSLMLTLMLGTAANAVEPGDVQRGKALYQAQCSACHSLNYNGVGPAHKGVFGRRAGSAPGYTYSPALAGSGLTWTEQTLARWLTDPEALVPGQKMGFKVADEQARADLIAFLKQAH